eukprot:COSAG02_NODE_1558_length_11928_cov_4.044974_5_plen_472_part_00
MATTTQMPLRAGAPSTALSFSLEATNANGVAYAHQAGDPQLSFSLEATDANGVAYAHQAGDPQQVCPRPSEFWVARVSIKMLSTRFFWPGLVLLLSLKTIQDMMVHQCWTGDTHPLVSMAWTFSFFSWFFFIGPGYAVQKEMGNGGSLERLGAGSEPVFSPTGVISTGLGLVQVRAITIAAIVCSIGGMGSAVLALYMLTADEPDLATFAWVLEASAVMVQPVFVFLVITFGLAIKIGTALASFRTVQARLAVMSCDPLSLEWETEVVTTVVKLVTFVLPTLSRGLSIGLIGGTIGSWLNAMSWLAWAIYYRTTAGAMYTSCAFGLACIPLVVIYDVAATSSECDLLVEALNEKRLTNCSDEHHIKISKLETMLRQLNKNQGMGVVIGGIVVDRKYLLNFFLQLSGLFMTGIGTMLALAPDVATNASTGCEMDASQLSLLQAVVEQFNDTCTYYNVTLGPSAVPRKASGFR